MKWHLRDSVSVQTVVTKVVTLRYQHQKVGARCVDNQAPQLSQIFGFRRLLRKCISVYIVQIILKCIQLVQSKSLFIILQPIILSCADDEKSNNAKLISMYNKW